MRRPKVPPEPINARAEELALAILAVVFGGVHHVESRDGWRRRRAWGDGILVTFAGSLATWDFAELAALVAAAHHYACRVEVFAVAPGRLALAFAPRAAWDGETPRPSVMLMHPTFRWQAEKWGEALARLGPERLADARRWLEWERERKAKRAAIEEERARAREAKRGGRP